MLAPAVQTSKTTFHLLHHRCKHFQKRFGHRVTPAETLCWRYSYIELTLRGRAYYVTEKMGQKGGIGLEWIRRGRGVLWQLWRAGKHSPYIFGVVFNE